MKSNSDFHTESLHKSWAIRLECTAIPVSTPGIVAKRRIEIYKDDGKRVAEG
jgi:hypothetical protein